MEGSALALAYRAPLNVKSSSNFTRVWRQRGRREINFAHTSGETIFAKRRFFSFRVERRRARWYRHAQLKRPAASDAGRRRTATAAPNELQVRHMHLKWYSSASRLLTTKYTHMQPARECIKFFPLTSILTRARARVFHLMQKINTHSSKRRILRMVRRAGKKTHPAPCVCRYKSRPFMCLCCYGRICKNWNGIMTAYFPHSVCAMWLLYLRRRVSLRFLLLESFLNGPFDVYCGTHCSMALPA